MFHLLSEKHSFPNLYLSSKWNLLEVINSAVSKQSYLFCFWISAENKILLSLGKINLLDEISAGIRLGFLQCSIFLTLPIKLNGRFVIGFNRRLNWANTDGFETLMLVVYWHCVNQDTILHIMLQWFSGWSVNSSIMLNHKQYSHSVPTLLRFQIKLHFVCRSLAWFCNYLICPSETEQHLTAPL